MSESVNSENKKQNHQKPPLSRRRIACEILAGMALGLVALLLVYVTGIVLVGKGEYAVPLFLTIFVTVFPPLNVYGSAVGVHLVGSRDKQTGSFLLTLVGSFLGGLVAVVTLFFLWWMGVGKIVLWAIGVLILLIPPIFATIGFNLTRRYEEPPLS
ncbi:MAG: hypothetical protein ACYS17_10560 [Planctomycetota bacterium]|jgi:hypothetical protein